MRFLYEASTSQLTLINDFLATNLDEFVAELNFYQNGQLFHQVLLSDAEKKIAPADSKTLKVELPKWDENAEIVLEVLVKYQQDQLWANAYGSL